MLDNSETEATQPISKSVDGTVLNSTLMRSPTEFVDGARESALAGATGAYTSAEAEVNQEVSKQVEVVKDPRQIPPKIQTGTDSRSLRRWHTPSKVADPSGNFEQIEEVTYSSEVAPIGAQIGYRK